MTVSAGSVPISRKQAYSIVEATGRVNLWEGAVRSGKTLGSLVKWLTYVASPPPGGQLVMVGRTRESLARNVIAPLQDPALFGDVADDVSYATGAPTATILGRKIHMLGASDAKAEKSLRGLTVSGAYCDELTVIRQDFFQQLLARMSVPGAQCFATTNPDNPAHWLKADYLDRLHKLPNWVTWHFNLEDNPVLTREYVDSLKREYSGLWYRRFILGEWVAADGAVFADWDPVIHTCDPSEVPRSLRLLGTGVDHGITNPSAGILIGQDRRGNLWAVDEWWMDSSEMQRKPTVTMQADSYLTWVRGIEGRAAMTHPIDDRGSELMWQNVNLHFVDPAAAAFRAELAMRNIGGVGEADNDVSYGLSSVSSLLSAGRLKISRSCRNLIREMPGYSWSTKATDVGFDAPIKVADHAVDALRYAVLSTENTWRQGMSDLVYQ